MPDTIQKSLKDHSLDGIFTEITHSEKLGLVVPEKLHLLYLDIRDNRFDLEKMKTQLYFNIGSYAFSRAVVDKWTKMGHGDVIIDQAKRILQKRGADVRGTGSELGEMLNYVFMEDKLDAPKLMSRVELSTDGASYNSETDNIHLLPAAVSGLPYHQVVFGSSSIVGDLKYAINNAFDRILRIEHHQNDELGMVSNLVLDTPTSRFSDQNDIDFLTDMIVPREGKKVRRNTSYAVFLGYTIGLDPENYSPVDFPDILEDKILDDLRRHLQQIIDLINKNHLGMKSFYFFIVPFNDAEVDKRTVMEDILKGDVNLGWPT